MTNQSILIACIGNIFLGDDGFGVEVARRMAARPPVPGVILKDFGIRGLDLTYALLESYELVILVDACPRGGEPGSVYLIEPDLAVLDPPLDPAAVRLEAHSMNPMEILRVVKSMGGPPNRILLVGCEPLDLGSDEEGKLGLSDPLMTAVDTAVQMIDTIVLETLTGAPLEAISQTH